MYILYTVIVIRWSMSARRPGMSYFSIFFGVRTGEVVSAAPPSMPWRGSLQAKHGVFGRPCGGCLSPTDLVGGLAKDNVLTKLVDPGLQLHTT